MTILDLIIRNWELSVVIIPIFVFAIGFLKLLLIFMEIGLNVSPTSCIKATDIIFIGVNFFITIFLPIIILQYSITTISKFTNNVIVICVAVPIAIAFLFLISSLYLAYSIFPVNSKAKEMLMHLVSVIILLCLYAKLFYFQCNFFANLALLLWTLFAIKTDNTYYPKSSPFIFGNIISEEPLCESSTHTITRNNIVIRNNMYYTSCMVLSYTEETMSFCVMQDRETKNIFGKEITRSYSKFFVIRMEQIISFESF